MKFRVRDFKREDYADILKIWSETDMGSPERGDTCEQIVKTIRAGARFLILENSDNSEIRGTCWITHDSRRAYIHHLAVLEAYQNRGFGRALLNKALETASEMGLQAKLEVHVSNANAVHMYLDSGFKELEGYLLMIKRK